MKHRRPPHVLRRRWPPIPGEFAGASLKRCTTQYGIAHGGDPIPGEFAGASLKRDAHPRGPQVAHAHPRRIRRGLIEAR